jgi:hypothetical protein
MARVGYNRDFDPGSQEKFLFLVAICTETTAIVCICPIYYAKLGKKPHQSLFDGRRGSGPERGPVTRKL